VASVKIINQDTEKLELLISNKRQHCASAEKMGTELDFHLEK
jgi:hypothetical protein